ncbi:unnamed protein product, partial [Laminaria digitata]
MAPAVPPGVLRGVGMGSLSSPHTVVAPLTPAAAPSPSPSSQSPSPSPSPSSQLSGASAAGAARETVAAPVVPVVPVPAAAAAAPMSAKPPPFLSGTPPPAGAAGGGGVPPVVGPAPLRSCLKQPARSPLTSKKRVRVSDEPPASQDPIVFSSDEEDATTAGGKGTGPGKDMRGEWPHQFKFRQGRKCTVCSKDFVRICTACGKCMDCF